MEFARFSVLNYSKDVVVDYIRYKTGRSERGSIAKKTQLGYLFPYLQESTHIKVRTIVIEDQYIERHYLEDYAEYYVRCFNQYPKICSRVHFFSSEFNERELRNALESDNETFSNKLMESYIGFIVIRPIPETFLAKICVKPYQALLDNKNSTYKILKKKNEVSLFGFNLCVETVALQEQDKVVAACATSAVWVFLNAYGHIVDSQLPSPSTITKVASPLSADGSRTFPSAGLNPIQVARSLKYFALEPTVCGYRKHGTDSSAFEKFSINEMKESMFAYLGNNIPLLLGGTIYRKTQNNENGDNKFEIRSLGDHLVCVLGYKVRDDWDKVTPDMNLKAHTLEKVYVHDDRYGPYTRLKLGLEEWDIPASDSDTEAYKAKGFTLSNYEADYDELFVPDLLIMGLYHKIRISIHNISVICKTLHQLIEISLTAYRSIDNLADSEIVINAYESIQRGAWSIELKTNNALKSELMSSDNFSSYTYGNSMSDFLATNLPRYIWRCRITKGKELFTDILFDATDVPQGNVIIGYISYDDGADAFWQRVSSEIRARAWHRFQENAGNPEQRSAINMFIGFFSAPERDISLTSLYGPVRPCSRELKPGETDFLEEIVLRHDLTHVWAESKVDLSKLETQKKYIWVIDQFGSIVYGEDINHFDNDFQGHPTLIDGEPARMGGNSYMKMV